MEATPQLGCACRVSAATPVTCGAAIDVPDKVSAPLPEPDAVETIATPGAVMSGLSALSPVRGPADENDAKLRKAGFGICAAGPTATLVDAASRPPSEVAVDARPRTPKKGMVTVNCSPVSGLLVIAPSKGGYPVVVSIIATA